MITCGEGHVLGDPQRHCIVHKCVARFVSKSSAFYSRY